MIPVDLPPLKPPKLPKRPRYDGPFNIVNLDLDEPMNYLQYEMFVNAPPGEPFDVSLKRLISTMRENGYREIRPTTIFLCYRMHPELSEPLPY